MICKHFDTYAPRKTPTLSGCLNKTCGCKSESFDDWIKKQHLWVRILTQSETVCRAMKLAYEANQKEA